MQGDFESVGADIPTQHVFYGIALLRVAATAATKPEDFESLVQTLYWEQVCKLRRVIAPKDEATWRTLPT